MLLRCSTELLVQHLEIVIEFVVVLLGILVERDVLVLSAQRLQPSPVRFETVTAFLSLTVLHVVRLGEILRLRARNDSLALVVLLIVLLARLILLCLVAC